MECSDSDALVIGGDDITLDCDGNSVLGAGNYNGIYNEENDDATIKNCNIYNFATGVYASGSNNMIIEGNTVTDTYDSGIYIEGKVMVTSGH
jgi:nitrous oxidase accessory protein NosD